MHELTRWVREWWDVIVQETSNPDEAVRGAGLVVTVTSARSSLFDEQSLDPSAHVTAIGADSPGKRELPSDS